jgi:hypothetical protein
MRTFADEITPLPMCLTVLPDYFLEISHKKSISSPFTTKGILKFPKYLIGTRLKIPHLLHEDLKNFPTEMSFSPQMGNFP